MSLWKKLAAGLEDRPIPPSPPPRIQYLEPDEIVAIVDSLDFERIRRAMLLFDIRWEAVGGFEVPDEEALHAYAHDAAFRTTERGRTFGMASHSERGFEISHALTSLGREFLSIQYVLTAARSVA